MKGKSQSVTFSWFENKQKPEFEMYILAEVEYTSMGGPHYITGQVELVNRNSWRFVPKEQGEAIDWKYVQRWAYLEEVAG